MSSGILVTQSLLLSAANPTASTMLCGTSEDGNIEQRPTICRLAGVTKQDVLSLHLRQNKGNNFSDLIRRTFADPDVWKNRFPHTMIYENDWTSVFVIL